MSLTGSGNEDNLFLSSTTIQTLLPFFTSSTGTYGLSAFVVLAIISALVKALPSLQTNHKSPEDLLLIASLILGSLIASFSANPMYAAYGVLLGFFLKAVVGLQHGLNAEDGILALGTILAGVGQFYGLTTLSSIGLLFGQFGKALAGGGTPSSPATVPATPPATPAPTVTA